MSEEVKQKRTEGRKAGRDEIEAWFYDCPIYQRYRSPCDNLVLWQPMGFQRRKPTADIDKRVALKENAHPDAR